ncbi:MAG: acylphosphatase, partial [Selenomonas bovis]|nr:acylphosphatase [Selenomonas bovis]
MSLYHSKIYGIVQGVGFRPFVSRLATKFGIRGSVANKGPYVEIFAQGSDVACQKFLHAIESEPPGRAIILRV